MNMNVDIDEIRTSIIDLTASESAEGMVAYIADSSDVGIHPKIRVISPEKLNTNALIPFRFIIIKAVGEFTKIIKLIRSTQEFQVYLKPIFVHAEVDQKINPYSYELIDGTTSEKNVFEALVSVYEDNLTGIKSKIVEMTSALNKIDAGDFNIAARIAGLSIFTRN